MTAFTLAAIWVLGILAFSAIAVCLWINKPEPRSRTERMFRSIQTNPAFTASGAHKAFSGANRRKWRDHDEHEGSSVG